MVNVHQSNSIDQIPSPNERLSLKDLAVSSGDKIDCKSYICTQSVFYIITAFMAADWKQKGLFPISKYLSCRLCWWRHTVYSNCYRTCLCIMALRLTDDLFRAFSDSNQKAAETDPINEGETIRKFMDAVLQPWISKYLCVTSSDQ